MFFIIILQNYNKIKLDILTNLVIVGNKIRGFYKF